MNLKDIKELLTLNEGLLAESPGISLIRFPLIDRPLELCLSNRFYRKCKKGRVWTSKEMLTALKNAEYGFRRDHAKSHGGSDGIFLLTREHRPKNEMMRKIFDQFLDKPGSGVEEVANELSVSVEELVPVRLVSHHMRLLGVMRLGEKVDVLVLVDYDDTK